MAARSELKCFKTLRSYWERIGLFPERIEDFTTGYSIRTSLLIFLFEGPFMLGILGYVITAFRGGVYNNLTFAIYALNFIASILACMVCFLIRGRQSLKFIIDLADTKYGKPKNFDFFVELAEKITTWLLRTLVVQEIMLVVTSHVRDAFCEEKELLNDDRVICGLAVPMWFPFKIPHARIVLSVYIFVFVMPFIATTTCGNMLYIGSVVPTIEKMKQLKEYIREIDFDDEKSSHEQLKLCVLYHTDIMGLVDQMNNTVGFIMSPQQNVVVVVMIGILEYQAVNDKNMIAALQLIIWLLVQFLACFTGQIFENASVALTHEVYNIEWYNMHPSLRNNYKVFQTQCQILLQCKIQPLITLNMEYFYKVIQSSYSFLMFLSNF